MTIKGLAAKCSSRGGEGERLAQSTVSFYARRFSAFQGPGRPAPGGVELMKSPFSIIICIRMEFE
jgi:hypothetical protein